MEVNLPIQTQTGQADELQTLLVLHPSFKIGLDLGEDETAGNVPPEQTGVRRMTRLQRKLKANQPLQDGRRVFLMADRDLLRFVVEHGSPQERGHHEPRHITNPPPTTETQIGRPLQASNCSLTTSLIVNGGIFAAILLAATQKNPHRRHLNTSWQRWSSCPNWAKSPQNQKPTADCRGSGARG